MLDKIKTNNNLGKFFHIRLEVLIANHESKLSWTIISRWTVNEEKNKVNLKMLKDLQG